MSELLIQSSTLEDIADAIRAKTGSQATMTPAEMVTEIGNIPSGGYVSNYFTLNEYMTSMYLTFRYANLPEEFTVDLTKLPSTARLSFSNAFQRSSGTDNLRKFIFVGDTSVITNYQTMLALRSNLTEIVGDLDFSNTPDAASREIASYSSTNPALAKISIVAGSIKGSIKFNMPALNADSVASIVAGLADLTGQTAATLTLHATPKALLTAEQIAEITSKNWNLA